MHKVQQAGPDDQARDDLAHHLRRFELAGHQPEELGTEDDDGEVAKNRIHKFTFLRFISFNRAVGRARPLFFYYIAAPNKNQNASQFFSLKKQTKFTKASVQIFVRIFGPQGLTKQQGLAIINCCLNRHAAHGRRCRMSCVPLAS